MISYVYIRPIAASFESLVPILMRTTKFLKRASVAAFVAALSIIPTGTQAATCSFSTDLVLGYQGEEVRCLQQYLNANGFNVATEGVGAPGKETSLYREKTVEAVRRWQVANAIAPATGTFGALSRAKYLSLGGAVTPTPTTPVPATPLPTVPSVPTTPTAEQADALKALTDARKQLNSVTTEVEEADDDGDDVDDAEDYLDETRDELLNALYSYLSKNWREARNGAYNAMDRIADARSSLEGSNDSDEGDAEDALDDARDLIEEAWADVEDADDDGEDVGEAEDLLEEAEDILDDAEDAFDDEDYNDVVDLVNDIEDLVDDALDSI